MREAYRAETVRSRSAEIPGRPDVCPARAERSQVGSPGANTQSAATSPEIVCLPDIRAGSSTGVANRCRKHQRPERKTRAFQHVLTPLLPAT